MYVNNAIPSFSSIQSFIPPIDIASFVMTFIIITILSKQIAKQCQMNAFVVHLPQSPFSVIYVNNIVNNRSTSYLPSSKTSYQDKAICNCISSITQLAFCSRSPLSPLWLFMGYNRKQSFLSSLPLCFLLHSPHFFINFSN